MKLSPERIALWKAIHKILWEDWDPIGIHLSGAPDDEYDGYVPQIFQLKIQNATEDTITNQLLIDYEYIMGLPGNINDCRQIAKKIIALD